MSTYSNRLQPALQNLLQWVVLSPEIVMHDAYIGGRFWRTKITRKASDAAAKPAIISSCSVLPPEIIMHGTYISVRSENNIKCIVVHNDLGRKNWTTQYNCRFSAASLALRVIFSVSLLWNMFGSFTEPFNYSTICELVNSIRQSQCNSL